MHVYWLHKEYWLIILSILQRGFPPYPAALLSTVTSHSITAWLFLLLRRWAVEIGLLLCNRATLGSMLWARSSDTNQKSGCLQRSIKTPAGVRLVLSADTRNWTQLHKQGKSGNFSCDCFVSQSNGSLYRVWFIFLKKPFFFVLVFFAPNAKKQFKGET